MITLLTFAAHMFFIACAAWVVAIPLNLLLRIHRPWPYSARDLLAYTTVVALTLAMAAALLQSQIVPQP